MLARRGGHNHDRAISRAIKAQDTLTVHEPSVVGVGGGLLLAVARRVIYAVAPRFVHAWLPRALTSAPPATQGEGPASPAAKSPEARLSPGGVEAVEEAEEEEEEAKVGRCVRVGDEEAI